MSAAYRVGIGLLLGLLVAGCWAQAQKTITGVVVDQDGAPLAGVTVRAPWLTELPDRHYVWQGTETDQDGGFALAVGDRPSPMSPYLLVASKDGYAIGLAKTELEQPVRITLSDRHATLRGTVTNAAGEALARVTITPKWVSLPTPGGMGPAFRSFLVSYAGCPLSTATDADGAFAIGGLPVASRVTVVVEAEGYVAEDARADIGLDGASVNMVLQAEGRISGRVLRDGQPVADVLVSASSTENSGETATSDERGYSIGGLTEGTYSVFAAKWHQGQISRTVTGISVGLGEHIEGVDVEMVEGGVIVGLVRNEETGQPIVGVGLTIRHADQPKYMHGERADDDGRYEVRVPPGEVTVEVSRSQARASEQPSVTVTVEDGGRVTAPDLFARALPDRRVLVTDEAGQPIAGAQVWEADSTRAYPPREPELTDATGHVELRRGPRMNFSQTPMVFARQPDAGLVGLVPWRQDGQATVVQLTPGGYLTARVLGPDGGPLGMGGATVAVPRAWEGSTNLPPHHASDEQGTLRIGPLPTGVPLKVHPDPVTDAMAVAEWPTGDTVTLAPGETRELPALRLDAAGRTVTGVVVDADGKAVRGQVVTSDTVTMRLTTVPTDADGRFSLSGLRCRDTVTLVACSEDGTLACGMTCDPDLGLALEVLVEPTGIAEGIVYTPDGKPCPKAGVEVWCMDLRWGIELPADLVREGAVATNERGAWRIEKLVPGLQYRVTARGDGMSVVEAKHLTALPGPMPVPVDMYLVDN